MFTQIIKNTKNLDVTSNEYQTPYSVQRIIDRLYQNDLALADFYDKVFGRFYIYQYDNSAEYQYNQLVWYINDSERTGGVLADLGKGLYILRCDINRIAPGSLSNYPKKSFKDLGWKNLNPNIDVLTEYGIKKIIDQYIVKQFNAHTNDVNMHPYGKISYNVGSANAVSSKIMKRNMENANPNRKQSFFPYETIYLRPDNQILTGYGRYYDNGLLEFDIVFQLAYAGFREIDSEYKISADILSCNNLDLRGINSDAKYFYSNRDADIFNPAETDSALSANLGGSIEYKKNDYCNVYAANIEFAQDNNEKHRFINTEYMIFAGDVTCQDRDIKYNSLNIGANQIVFAQKTTTGFTALYITYPNQQNYNSPGYNAKNSGLMLNSFHCHVIGKWK